MKKALEEQLAFQELQSGVQGMHMSRPAQLEVIIYTLPQASSEEELLWEETVSFNLKSVIITIH